MIYNFLGLTLLLISNVTFPAVFSVIIQIPLQVPVFQREKSNRMYGITPYLFGRALAGYLLNSTYPLIFTLIMFWGLAIPTGIDNFALFLLAGLLVYYNGISLGYFCGVLFDDDTGARTVSNFFLLFFLLTSGGLANAASFPPFIAQLVYLSPMRYGAEAYFRRLVIALPVDKQ